MVKPFVLFGIGATQYAGGVFQGHNLRNETKFSTIWGGGARVFSDRRMGLKFSGLWTPTYIKTDAEGEWCDPYWGCFVVSDGSFSHQFELSGGAVYRF
jgi:hypothetical protein